MVDGMLVQAERPWPWEVFGFRNCGRAVAHVRGYYVPRNEEARQLEAALVDGSQFLDCESPAPSTLFGAPGVDLLVRARAGSRFGDPRGRSSLSATASAHGGPCGKPTVRRALRS